ncbi:SphA family protein [Thiocapsa sp.]|uniref:SphA family protein n=1 Tax=Thiocapsa sp. TaxID=2024551 RepID=UPI002BB5EBB2|nr:transporter [Thiocapsa sp.]HSO81011.1 transporter [Thiocapsa sp.]
MTQALDPWNPAAHRPVCANAAHLRGARDGDDEPLRSRPDIAPPYRRRALVLGLATLAALTGESTSVVGGEGGTSHVIPGANATLADLPPTTPGVFFKPMFLRYQGEASAQIPTAAGIVANVHATVETLILGGGYTVQPTLLGGARYSVAAFLPYSWMDISADSEALGGIGVQSRVSGFGDLTVVPVMLAWKPSDWQYDFLLPIYAPTGSYELGRLGNPGLNYWTFDPIVGAAYSGAKTGLNAAIHLGYAMNTENPDTDYRSGDLLHVDASVQQIFPLGSGYLNVGAEGWYFQQVTGDTGSGARLGDFEGRTAGIGPVIGYIQPLGQQKLVLELKWLPELETRNRLNGDYLWLKAVYKF